MAKINNVMCFNQYQMLFVLSTNNDHWTGRFVLVCDKATILYETLAPRVDSY